MPLTPNLFLINRLFNTLPPWKFYSQDLASFKFWKNVQQMVNHFWKRLVKVYFPTLLKRSKWSDSDQTLRVNDIVWILKYITPRGIWPLRRFLKVFPGRNGQHPCRVVKVKTVTARTFTRSPRLHAFWLISPFFRNGSLGHFVYFFFDDLVRRLWCVLFMAPSFPWSMLCNNQVRSESWKKHWLLSLSQEKRVACSRNFKQTQKLECLELCNWIFIYIFLQVATVSAWCTTSWLSTMCW